MSPYFSTILFMLLISMVRIPFVHMGLMGMTIVLLYTYSSTILWLVSMSSMGTQLMGRTYTTHQVDVRLNVRAALPDKLNSEVVRGFILGLNETTSSAHNYILYST